LVLERRIERFFSKKNCNDPKMSGSNIDKNGRKNASTFDFFKRARREAVARAAAPPKPPVHYSLLEEVQ
jgi:hypothetical protein